MQNDECKICEFNLDQRKTASLDLSKKYSDQMNFYQTKVINDILFNEPSHLTTVFKEYLIQDDRSDFLKRFYSEEES